MAAIELEPGLRRITAPNPSPMTFHGTNTYLLGTREIAVIDPGPADGAHLDAILAALEPDQHITHILVTHSHLDHSPLAAPLSVATGAPVLAAGPSDWGRTPVMQALAATGELGGGEGVDTQFTPSQILRHGDLVQATDWQLSVLHTPGHMANHLSFAWNGTLFSGDLVMGWSTSLVSPPDGDMTSFMASLRQLRQRSDRIYYPGHGAPVGDPATRLDQLVTHRLGREVEVLSALSAGPATPNALTRAIYTEIPAALHPMAERNVLAHLIDLTEQSKVTPLGTLRATAQFALS
ncbi:MAG: glyoxylase-like metal-dependent hydrolase (beta-lactamase superfamily II) [Paracoccaceae bacterium]|jgi:glyoxylase-like metal-dependent hydrolase (beta-lactamase superfamily II)